MTLGQVPPSRALIRLRERRAELGLPAGDHAPLLIDPVSGEPVGEDNVPMHLRRARVTAVSLTANASICSGMLRHRYDTAGQGEAPAAEPPAGPTPRHTASEREENP